MRIGYLLILALFAARPTHADQIAFMKVGGKVRAPFLWTETCKEDPNCPKTVTAQVRDVVLSEKAMADLGKVTSYINKTVKVEPCSREFRICGVGGEVAEAKQKMLIDAGWPGSALLLTQVIQHADKVSGYTFLTVKTDQGEYFLIHQSDEVVRWADWLKKNPGFSLLKRQSQSDSSVWVTIAP